MLCSSVESSLSCSSPVQTAVTLSSDADESFVAITDFVELIAVNGGQTP